MPFSVAFFNIYYFANGVKLSTFYIQRALTLFAKKIADITKYLERNAFNREKQTEWETVQKHLHEIL